MSAVLVITSSGAVTSASDIKPTALLEDAGHAVTLYNDSHAE
jgi:hypothetical protein